jgi:hypothetical protein
MLRDLFGWRCYGDARRGEEMGEPDPGIGVPAVALEHRDESLDRLVVAAEMAEQLAEKRPAAAGTRPRPRHGFPHAHGDAPRATADRR